MYYLLKFKFHLALCILICSICCPLLWNRIRQLVLRGTILRKYYPATVSLRSGTVSNPLVSSLPLSHPPSSHNAGLSVSKAGTGSPFTPSPSLHTAAESWPAARHWVGTEDRTSNETQHQQVAPYSNRTAESQSTSISVWASKPGWWGRSWKMPVALA